MLQKHEYVCPILAMLRSFTLLFAQAQPRCNTTFFDTLWSQDAGFLSSWTIKRSVYFVHNLDWLKSGTAFKVVRGTEKNSSSYLLIALEHNQKYPLWTSIRFLLSSCSRQPCSIISHACPRGIERLHVDFQDWLLINPIGFLQRNHTQQNCGSQQHEHLVNLRCLVKDIHIASRGAVYMPCVVSSSPFFGFEEKDSLIQS